MPNRIQIDLHREFKISQTGTQGRYGGGHGKEYAEQFLLEYWRPSVGQWMTYRNHSGHSVLEGNTNTYLEKLNVLSPPIVASKVRFVPQSTHSRTVCMRVEVFGCPYTDPLLSYSMREPDEFAPNFYMDDIYDGNRTSRGILFGGLGLLSDGHYGHPVTLHNYGINPCKFPSCPLH